MAKATAEAKVHDGVTDTAAEVSDQAEYNFHLMEAPIADFAKFAGIELDEAVSRRIEAVRQIPDFSQIKVDVRQIPAQGKLIGLALVEYHGFKVDNFKVFNGDKGLFVGEPTVWDQKAKTYVKTLRLTDPELKDALNKKALEGYHAAVDKLQARAAEAKKMEVKPPMQKQYEDAAKQAAAYNASRPTPEKSNRTQTAEL